MSKIPLTARQREMYEYIVWFIKENQISPTYREIAEQFGIGFGSGAQSVVKRLELKGYIDIVPEIARGIRVVVGKTCPCCGQEVADTKAVRQVARN